MYEIILFWGFSVCFGGVWGQNHRLNWNQFLVFLRLSEQSCLAHSLHWLFGTFGSTCGLRFDVAKKTTQLCHDTTVVSVSLYWAVSPVHSRALACHSQAFSFFVCFFFSPPCFTLRCNFIVGESPLKTSGEHWLWERSFPCVSPRRWRCSWHPRRRTWASPSCECLHALEGRGKTFTIPPRNPGYEGDSGSSDALFPLWWELILAARWLQVERRHPWVTGIIADAHVAAFFRSSVVFCGGLLRGASYQTQAPFRQCHFFFLRVASWHKRTAFGCCFF